MMRPERMSSRNITGIGTLGSNNYIISEDLIAGTKHNGKMSRVRRFFCLLVTFDLLVTCLLWLICTVTAGQSITTAFEKQLIHYDIKTSLIDIVIVAAIRFTFLLLFYGLIYMNHWIIVAISTAGTSIFLSVKVYFFDWTEITQPGFLVLLIFVSFVIAWAETWHFDCRVVSLETLADLWISNTRDSERSPLLNNYLNIPARSYVAESVGTFFTPQDSPIQSDDEDNNYYQSGSVVNNTNKPKETPDTFIPTMKSYLTPNKISKYKSMASSLVDCAHELLTSPDWKIINTTSDGDILSVLTQSYGQVFKIEGVVDAVASELIDYLYDKIEELPKWNKDVIDAKKILFIDDDTDIVYQSTKPYGRGLIDSRDFVTLRSRGKRDKFFITSGSSLHGDFPKRDKFIRGENGIVCMATEPIAVDSISSGIINQTKCKFTWILNTNLNGWLPQRVIDNALTNTLVNFMIMMRLHIKALP
ncbi:hypothetical protein HCN44_001578 [Aphidius gifuensis]|uniref:StAR-related lipid transfer protein 3 n=1 Tax=Aphidius gifuensis TaxID=684658 RepID=A0A835CSG6_APHGI|nr:steroidogenic acute regulatory protein-like [Aphidius gifuensis]KAF7992253.1 hypothetical protein HCN44_001578 [Aphidius gifuensis]